MIPDPSPLFLICALAAALWVFVFLLQGVQFLAWPARGPRGLLRLVIGLLLPVGIETVAVWVAGHPSVAQPLFDGLVKLGALTATVLALAYAAPLHAKSGDPVSVVEPLLWAHGVLHRRMLGPAEDGPEAWALTRMPPWLYAPSIVVTLLLRFVLIMPMMLAQIVAFAFLPLLGLVGGWIGVVPSLWAMASGGAALPRLLTAAVGIGLTACAVLAWYRWVWPALFRPWYGDHAPGRRRHLRNRAAYCLLLAYLLYAIAVIPTLSQLVNFRSDWQAAWNLLTTRSYQGWFNQIGGYYFVFGIPYALYRIIVTGEAPPEV